MNTYEVQVINHQSEFGEWELARRLPHPGLSPFVLRYTGYIEREALFPSRLEVPSPQLVMIVNFGPAIGITSNENPGAEREIGSFVSGLFVRPVFVRSLGPMRCAQIDLTPIGARFLFNQPMRDFANQSIPLGDILGANANSLEDNLDSLKSWSDRFRVIDQLLTSRLRIGRPVVPGVVWSWNRLLQSGGELAISQLADEVGWSRKHLTATLRDELGLPPKQIARMIRFDRAVSLANASTCPDWLNIAHACGYADQSHFNRDFRSFAGITPSEFVSLRMPDGGVLGQ